MLNKKEVIILEMLIHKSFKYLTSQEIAYNIGVSDKTSRKYLKNLDEAIDDKVARIRSVRGRGYQLIIQDDIAFKEFYQNNSNNEQSIQMLNTIGEPKDRHFFILRRLFFENNLVYPEDLMEELYVSSSTLMNDITEINSMLIPFGLVLRTSKKKGLNIIGNEQKKRHFIIKYFLVDRYHNNLKSFGKISLFLTSVRLEEILIIVLDEYRNSHLGLNDTMIFNVSLHIALALKRVKDGYQIYSSIDDDDLNDVEEIQTAKNIIYRLEKSTGILLPDIEIRNIALHLRSKELNNKLLLSKSISELELRNQVIEGLKKIEQKTNCLYSEDSVLVDGLMTHFIPFILRLNSEEKIQNPLLKEIKTDYKFLFNQSKQAFLNMKIIKDKEISDDEWAYIALHIISAHERQISKSKARIVVICATGLGSSQLVKMRLENELGSKLIIKDVISYYEITEEILKDIDFVVSSIDLSNIVFSVPIVNVSVLLNEKDIKEINKVISSNYIIDNKIDNKVLDEPKSIQELVDHYFDPSLFVKTDKLVNREDAIDVLIDKSVEQDSSIDKDFLKYQLELRENFSSVVFARNIAVPHPIEAASNKAKIAVLITPKGIEWDLYNKDIKLILLLLPDRFGNHHIEKASQALLPIFECQSSVDTLVNAKEYRDFKSKLIKLLS